MIQYVYVVYVEYDYEGCNTPEGVFSTWDAAFACAEPLIEKGAKRMDDIDDGLWTFSRTMSSHSVHIERFVLG